MSTTVCGCVLAGGSAFLGPGPHSFKWGRVAPRRVGVFEGLEHELTPGLGGSGSESGVAGPDPGGDACAAVSGADLVAELGDALRQAGEGLEDAA